MEQRDGKGEETKETMNDEEKKERIKHTTILVNATTLTALHFRQLNYVVGCSVSNYYNTTHRHTTFSLSIGPPILAPLFAKRFRVTTDHSLISLLYTSLSGDTTLIRLR
ncbi:hypothetical protein I312_102671 [Cryptococcus bacillisporus CA1280]|uniref:uncharacterized protein n=1 Tax=Cryptococcus bacillisporus CA1280 TaxID=1296109 RepID=UPI003367105B